MKLTISALSLLISAILMTPTQAMPGYLGMTISEYDMLGCKSNPQSPRCKRVVNVGCKSICQGHENDNSDLGHVCHDLCQAPDVKPQTQDVKNQTSQKKDLPLLTDLSFPIPEEE